MQKSLLDIYLKKVSLGEAIYLERLCYQLSDSVVYLPVSQVNEDEWMTSVAPILCGTSERPSIPIFTQYRFFDEWQHEQSLAITLKVGDLCASLADGCPIIVDPGTDHAVVLPATIVKDLGTLALRECGVEAGISNQDANVLYSRATRMNQCANGPTADYSDIS